MGLFACWGGSVHFLWLFLIMVVSTDTLKHPKIVLCRCNVGQLSDITHHHLASTDPVEVLSCGKWVPRTSPTPWGSAASMLHMFNPHTCASAEIVKRYLAEKNWVPKKDKVCVRVCAHLWCGSLCEVCVCPARYTHLSTVKGDKLTHRW